MFATIWATANGPELPVWGEVLLAAVFIPFSIWFVWFFFLRNGNLRRLMSGDPRKPSERDQPSNDKDGV